MREVIVVSLSYNLVRKYPPCILEATLLLTDLDADQRDWGWATSERETWGIHNKVQRRKNITGQLSRPKKLENMTYAEPYGKRKFLWMTSLNITLPWRYSAFTDRGKSKKGGGFDLKPSAHIQVPALQLRDLYTLRSPTHLPTFVALSCLHNRRLHSSTNHDDETTETVTSVWLGKSSADKWGTVYSTNLGSNTIW